MNNPNKNQDRDRKGSMNSDDNRNRDKYGQEHHQGSTKHTGQGSSGSKTADGDQNRNTQR